MERFVEFMRRNENDKELRSTKILKFGWMIGLSSTSNICNLSKFNNLDKFNNLSMHLLWEFSMEKLNNDDTRVVGSKYRIELDSIAI